MSRDIEFFSSQVASSCGFLPRRRAVWKSLLLKNSDRKNLYFDTKKTLCYTFYVSKNDSVQPALRVKTIFKGDTSWIGLFRCSANHPEFHAPNYFSWHNMIVFPRTAVELHFLGQETIISSPNIAVFYNCGQEYYRQILSEKGDWCEWFQFRPSLLLEVIRHYDPRVDERDKRPFLHTHTPIATRWLLLERQIVEHLVSAVTPDSWWVNETTLMLLNGIIADSYRVRGLLPQKKPRTRRLHQTLVTDTQRLLVKHLHEPLTLTQLANLLYTSPFHLSRIFRQQTGSTLHNYLERLRLRTALERLPAYKNDLTTLALTVGYKNHSHFTHAFHRAFGLPPSLMNYQIAFKRFIVS